jgi:UDP-glucuronate 4-epimerase
MQSGDLNGTYADITRFQNKFGYRPKTELDEGVKKFVEWYRAYYT